jgi:hypothetical protein
LEDVRIAVPQAVKGVSAAVGIHGIKKGQAGIERKWRGSQAAEEGGVARGAGQSKLIDVRSEQSGQGIAQQGAETSQRLNWKGSGRKSPEGPAPKPNAEKGALQVWIMD